jgi:hypothetical protein
MDDCVKVLKFSDTQTGISVCVPLTEAACKYLARELSGSGLVAV